MEVVEEAWEGLRAVIRDPFVVSMLCFAYIVSYYAVTGFCLRAVNGSTGWWWRLWNKNGPLDVMTSVLWVLGGLTLTWSLMECSLTGQLSIPYLTLYFGFFIFIFAVCYCIVEWHFGKSLRGVDPHTWRAQLQYLLVSVETQTSLGYAQAKPTRLLSECVAAVQALLGLFFVVVIIAKAVNR